MRVGVVDLGTNSVRFDVYDVRSSGRLRNLCRNRQMIRLGQSVFTRGRLDKEAIARLIAALEEYREEAEQLSVSRVFAYGTAALREASNQREVVTLIRRRTGLRVRVISGRQEARLIARGVLARDSRCRGRFALIDIGGGSTEITVCESKQVLCATSLPLGVARLKARYLPEIPARGTDRLERHIDRVLTRDLPRQATRNEIEKMIGSSGTIKTLARILRRTTGEKSIRLKALGNLRRELSRMSRRQLLKVPGLTDRRADMIVPGAILLEHCMRRLGTKKVVPTPYALRDGLIEELLESRRRTRT